MEITQGQINHICEILELDPEKDVRYKYSGLRHRLGRSDARECVGFVLPRKVTEFQIGLAFFDVFGEDAWLIPNSSRDDMGFKVVVYFEDMQLAEEE